MKPPPSDADLLALGKAVSHPIRLAILRAVIDAEDARSPKQLARALEQRLETVSYHVGVLRDLGYLELVATHPRRGAVEHRYALRPPAQATLTSLLCACGKGCTEPKSP